MFDSKLGEFTVSYDNTEEFHHLKQEVFTRNIYYFETDNPRPVIIDAGAHIGLATLYFKKMYPQATVIAIEPNPQTFALLQTNVANNFLAEVELHQIALSTQSGTQKFYLDRTLLHWWSTSGFIDGAWNHRQKSQEIQVKTAPLAQFLTQPTDLLKLDIEGAEQAVLQAASDRLHWVKQMVIEFHPHAQQSLAKVLALLKKHHFTTSLWQDGHEVTADAADGLVLIEALQIHN